MVLIYVHDKVDKHTQTFISGRWLQQYIQPMKIYNNILFFFRTILEKKFNILGQGYNYNDNP